jgi:hypothetical protein
MLTHPTVLVLGAGASKPFDFPTGLELSAMVSNELRPGHHAYNVLQDPGGFAGADINTFREEFYFSGKNSVDAFLEHRTDLIEIGKAVTAVVLIGYEDPDKLFRFEPPNWLRYIYNNLNTSFEDFGRNTLSFVTFNYDRTVEHFFFESLKRTYHKTDEECKSVLSQIPIIHLHGRLGFLPWQRPNGRPYSTLHDLDGIRASIDEIKIIHEDISDGRDKDFESAKQLMQNAYRILFLGFGYNRTNIERLGIADLPDGKAIGTSIGLGNKESSVVTEACHRKIHLVNRDCMHFVREFIDWD